MTDIPVDAIYAQLAEGAGPIPNWLGVWTRREFFTPELKFVELTPPAPIDSECFEWLDLIRSVVQARKRYTMFELGAGYGRWIVNAAAAVRTYGGLQYRLLAVEAEPSHFRWLKQHCRDNGLRRRSQAGSTRLLRAAVDSTPGSVEFATGRAESWYGQAIADSTWEPEKTEKVKAVTLSTLLERHHIVDFIHMDIQGAELGVMEEARDALAEKALRVHIGTHSEHVEAGLRVLFQDLAWSPIHDYPCNSVTKTPYGDISFQDGVQAWENPKLLAVHRGD
jgi:FkbM family methyltransferase